MVFQWYLFVLIAVVAFIANSTGMVQQVNVYENKELRYTWIPVLVITLPMIYLAATRGDMGFGDTAAYRTWFNSCPSEISEISSYIAEETKDKGFSVLMILIKSVIGDNVVLFFGIMAMVGVGCVAYTYKNYSCNFVMSMFLFIASGEYIQWNYNGIRQFFAVAIIFGATKWLLEKKYIPLIILILLLSTIHGTALLMLPIIFIVQGKPWNRKTLLFLFAVILAILYLDQFTNLITTFMENSQYSKEVDQFLGTEGTNALRVFVFAIPPMVSLLFKRYVDVDSNPIINLCINMSIISLGIYVVSAFTSGIFVGRIPIYFSLYNYILIPWLVEHIFEKRSTKIVYFVIIVAYLIFYYYQVDITWGL